MEYDIRGVVEGAMDHYTDSEVLGRTIEHFVEFTPILESREDALFGYVMGKVVGNLFALVLMKYDRDVTDAEMEEMFGILYRRAEEIKEKIRLTLMT